MARYANSPDPCLLNRVFNLNKCLGQSQYINPIPASPLTFNLSVDDNGYRDSQFGLMAQDNDNRLMEMLAAQAAHREDGSIAGDEESIASNPKLSDAEKKLMLQKFLHMAASNGDVERVRRLVDGKPRKYVDVNGADEEGTASLIYASCFVSMHLLIYRPSPSVYLIYRGIKKWSPYYLRLVLKSIGKTETNGHRSCGL